MPKRMSKIKCNHKTNHWLLVPLLAVLVGLLVYFSWNARSQPEPQPVQILPPTIVHPSQ